MRNSLAGLFSLLPAKAAAAAVAVTLVAAGGTAALATHVVSLPTAQGAHGKLVTSAVFGSCAHLRPTPRTAGTTGTSQRPASPGAFGRCVSAVARSGHGQGHGTGAMNAHGTAGQALGQGHGHSGSHPGSGQLPQAATTHGHGAGGANHPTPAAGPFS